MAKQTAAQKKAEYEAQAAQRREETRASYYPRLMQALEEATVMCYMVLKVRDNHFHVCGRHDSREYYTLSPVYTDDAEDELENLEYELRRQQNQRAEAARLHALQQQARAKLSPEELAALGL